MKRLLLLLCIIALSICNIPTAVYAADSSFATPIGRECYFFAQKDEATALFAVPYTYCVQIIRTDGDWYYVRYAENEGNYRLVTGYCKASEFTLVEDPPVNLFLHKTVTVRFSAGDTQGSLTPPADMEVEAAYYGAYRYGAAYYSYVYCRGEFCYIEGANDEYPLNDLPKKDDNQGEKPPTEEQQGGANGLTGLIIFLVLLFIALLAICALLITAKRPKFDK